MFWFIEKAVDYFSKENEHSRGPKSQTVKYRMFSKSKTLLENLKLHKPWKMNHSFKCDKNKTKLKQSEQQTCANMSEKKRTVILEFFSFVMQVQTRSTGSFFLSFFGKMK